MPVLKNHFNHSNLWQKKRYGFDFAQPDNLKKNSAPDGFGITRLISNFFKENLGNLCEVFVFVCEITLLI